MTIEKLQKGFEALNAQIAAFGIESDEPNEVTLYEDAYTTRCVAPNFKLCKNLNLHWTEGGVKETYQHYNIDDAYDTLKFWRANLRRAKKYWAMDGDQLDAIHNGEVEDVED